ncbi:hypothetical protein FEK35_18135 [Nocardia cyriacigeorgica]|uniref:Tox-PL domain-containing protein n=1 Tax=Nocardia cyriacigeorgica TaxID=135487 RepID=A0A5R8PBS6_9NOCA|nr:polymorphic toxin type 30 domain-containing protein [Nocardia cyriacigeorgica]TLG06287.1 hypothetical protein FEK35_18135 [Nocardia cyriacigeorgica]
MGIEIPEALQWAAKYVVGAGDWPEGDETAMRRMADAYTTAATTFDDLGDDAQRQVNQLLSALDGQTADAIEAFWKKLGNNDGALSALTELLRNQADVVDDGANDIEHTKLMIIAQLVIFAVEMAAALAAAATGVGAPAGAAAGAAARVATQITIRMLMKQLLQRIVSRVVKEAALGALEEGGLDLGIRLIQAAKGDRELSRGDFTAVWQSAAGGAIGGAISGGLGREGGLTNGVGEGAGNALGNRAKQFATDYATEVASDIGSQAAMAAITGEEFELSADTFTSAAAGAAQNQFDRGGDDGGDDEPGNEPGNDPESGGNDPEAQDNDNSDRGDNNNDPSGNDGDRSGNDGQGGNQNPNNAGSDGNRSGNQNPPNNPASNDGDRSGNNPSGNNNPGGENSPTNTGNQPGQTTPANASTNDGNGNGNGNGNEPPTRTQPGDPTNTGSNNNPTGTGENPATNTNAGNEPSQTAPVGSNDSGHGNEPPTPTQPTPVGSLDLPEQDSPTTSPDQTPSPLDLPSQAPAPAQEPTPLDLPNQNPAPTQEPSPLDLPSQDPAPTQEPTPLDLPDQNPTPSRADDPLDLPDQDGQPTQAPRPLDLPPQDSPAEQTPSPLDLPAPNTPTDPDAQSTTGAPLTVAPSNTTAAAATATAPSLDGGTQTTSPSATPTPTSTPLASPQSPTPTTQPGPSPQAAGPASTRPTPPSNSPARPTSPRRNNPGTQPNSPTSTGSDAPTSTPPPSPQGSTPATSPAPTPRSGASDPTPPSNDSTEPAAPTRDPVATDPESPQPTETHPTPPPNRPGYDPTIHKYVAHFNDGRPIPRDPFFAGEDNPHIGRYQPTEAEFQAERAQLAANPPESATPEQNPPASDHTRPDPTAITAPPPSRAELGSSSDPAPSLNDGIPATGAPTGTSPASTDLHDFTNLEAHRARTQLPSWWPNPARDQANNFPAPSPSTTNQHYPNSTFPDARAPESTPPASPTRNEPSVAHGHPHSTTPSRAALSTPPPTTTPQSTAPQGIDHSLEHHRDPGASNPGRTHNPIPNTPGTHPHSPPPRPHPHTPPPNNPPRQTPADQARAARQFYRNQPPVDGRVTRVSSNHTGRPAYEIRRHRLPSGEHVSVLTVRVHLAPGQNVGPADLQRLMRNTEYAIDHSFNTAPQLLGGDRLLVDVEFTSNPADAHIQAGTRRGIGDFTSWSVDSSPAHLTDNLRLHIGLTPSMTDNAGFDQDELRRLSNDIAATNTDTPLSNPSDLRVNSPGRLREVELAAYQHAVEDSLRNGSEFTVGADPRTHPYGQLINDGGPNFPGRSNNCLDCSLSALSSFYGNPQVSAPRWRDRLPDGTLDRFRGEAGGLGRAASWLNGSWRRHGTTGAPIADQFAELHNQVAAMGPGSSAIVHNSWTQGGSHATVIVYPIGASGPVWWDPQSGKTSDTPPDWMVQASNGLESILISPQQGASNAGTAGPNQSASGAVPGPDLSQSTAHHSRDGVRLGGSAEPDSGGTRERSRPWAGELRSEQADRSGDGPSQSPSESDRRGIRRGDQERAADSGLPGVPTGVAGTSRPDTGDSPGNRVSGPSNAPDRAPAATDQRPAGDQQTDPRIPNQHSSTTPGVPGSTGVDGMAQSSGRDLAPDRDIRVLGTDSGSSHRTEEPHPTSLTPNHAAPEPSPAPEHPSDPSGPTQQPGESNTEAPMTSEDGQSAEAPEETEHPEADSEAGPGPWNMHGIDPMRVVPDHASVRQLTPDSNGGAQYGLEFKWVDSEGRTVRLRIHGPDGTAPPGSNAAEGDTYRIQFGGRYQDASGQLYPRNVHNPNSPHYDAEAANNTHIPWPPDQIGL